MQTYHKIQTAYLRDPATNHKTLLRGQWAKPEFEYLKDNLWEATEKIDGTNIRVMFDGEKVWFNGKTDNANTHKDLLKYLANTFTLEKMQAQFGVEPTEVCLYGEGFGAGIQSGGYYRQDKGFILFDTLIGGVWLERPSIEDIAKAMECPIVPIITIRPLEQLIEIVADGFLSMVAEDRGHQAEGLIMKPLTQMFNRRGERIITKIKAKDFNAR